MKKSLLMLTVISALYATAAAAQDQNFYAGAGIGSSNADVATISRQDVLGIGFNSLSSFQSGVNKSDTAWKVYGGYRFNPHIAAEVFYSDLGKFSRNASGSGATTSSPTTDFSVKSSLTMTGFGAAALLGMPLSAQWQLFAKPGLLYWNAKDATTATVSINNTNTAQSGSTEKTGTSPSFGLGTAYAFTDKLGARLEWDEYFDIGDKNTTGQSNVNVFALSLQYTP
jgi:OOP family OmpA-OmpF porin